MKQIRDRSLSAVVVDLHLVHGVQGVVLRAKELDEALLKPACDLKGRRDELLVHGKAMIAGARRVRPQCMGSSVWVRETTGLPLRSLIVLYCGRDLPSKCSKRQPEIWYTMPMRSLRHLKVNYCYHLVSRIANRYNVEQIFQAAPGGLKTLVL